MSDMKAIEINDGSDATTNVMTDIGKFDLVLVISTLHELRLQAILGNRSSLYSHGVDDNSQPDSREKLNLLYSEQVLRITETVGFAIRRLLDKKSNISILDVGCGFSPYLKNLPTEICDRLSVTFVDKDSSLFKDGSLHFEDIKRIYKNRCKVICCDLMPYICNGKNTSDSNQQINFLPNFFIFISKVLNKDGLLLLAEFYYPHYLSVDEIREMISILRKKVGHGDPLEAFYLPSTIENVAYDSNLKLIKQIEFSPINLIDFQDLTIDEQHELMLLSKRRFFEALYYNDSSHDNKEEILDLNFRDLEKDIAEDVLNIRKGTKYELFNKFINNNSEIANFNDIKTLLNNIFESPNTSQKIWRLIDSAKKIIKYWNYFERNKGFKVSSYSYLSIWISITTTLSRLFDRGSNFQRRFDPFEKSEKLPCGYLAFKDNDPVLKTDISTFAFNYLLSPELQIDNKIISGRSINSLIKERNSYIENSVDHIDNLIKSVAFVCCLDKDPNVDKDTLDQVTTIENLCRSRNKENYTIYCHFDGSFGSKNKYLYSDNGPLVDGGNKRESLSKFLFNKERTSDQWDKTDEISYQMLLTFLDYLFLGYRYSSAFRDQPEYLNSILLDFKSRAKDRFVKIEKKYGFANIIYQQYEPYLELACKRLKVFIDEFEKKNKNSETHADYPSVWLTVSLDEPGSKIPVSSVMFFSNGIVGVEFIEQWLRPLLRRPLMEYYAVENDLVDTWKNTQLKLSNTKSAIGSIMSRNGSHNIGSHVLAALSHNVGTMPDDRILYQYIQHRMDYIATVTTDFPTWSGETKFVNGLIRRFLSQRHLLEYIASSEGLHAFKFQDPNISGTEKKDQKGTIKLHVRRCDQKRVNFIDYGKLDDKSESDKLKNDISVATSGGIIGSHAFFTILENIIRNAAKHGWSKQNEMKRDNLDIYVDFSENSLDVSVYVYDGISDVFALPRQYAQKDNKELTKDQLSFNEAIKSFKSDIEKWRDKEYKKYSKNELSISGSLTQKDVETLKIYLSGESENLLELYKPIKDALLKKINDKPIWKYLKDYLVGNFKDNNDFGSRLWLPLHHKQQVKLSQPFIDVNGALRRENWGLAEMKISAGYLNRRSISDIGGLSFGNPIITPVCINDSENTQNSHDYLGYHFTLSRPREIAFVLNEEDFKKVKVERIIELEELGIFVKQYPKEGKFLKPRNEKEEDWSYSFVVLPKFSAENNPHLPFRVLAKDNSALPDKVPSAQPFYDNFVNELINNQNNVSEIAINLKKKTYKIWVDYWCKRRGLEYIPELKLDPTKDKDKGSERGLIRNSDVWAFVLKELLRSNIGTFLKNAEEQGFVDNILEVYTFFEILVALPKRYDGNIVSFCFEGSKELIAKIDKEKRPQDSLVREMLIKQFVEWTKEFFTNSSKNICDLKKSLIEFRKNYNLKDQYANLIDDSKAIEKAKSFFTKLSNACKYENDKNEIYVAQDGYENGLEEIIQSLISAYRESDVILRKYEERIISLPQIFVDEDNDKDDADSNWNFVYDGNKSIGKSIVFQRHADSVTDFKDDMLYLEPLSGTQSYLYELMMVKKQGKDSLRQVPRLYETGLSRILILDERVSKFLKEHSDELKTFCRMGIWCIDEKNFADNNNQENEKPIEKIDSLLSLNKNALDAFINDAINEKSNEEKLIGNNIINKNKLKFDILIIHQGLIDKWVPQSESCSDKVEKFINALKKRIDYVVITTGRGTPANTPNSARILPFPVLETTLFKKYPEKKVLVDTIMNILPIGEH